MKCINCLLKVTWIKETLPENMRIERDICNKQHHLPGFPQAVFQQWNWMLNSRHFTANILLAATMFKFAIPAQKKRNNKLVPWGKQPEIVWALREQGIKPQKVQFSESCRNHRNFSIHILYYQCFVALFFLTGTLQQIILRNVISKASCSVPHPDSFWVTPGMKIPPGHIVSGLIHRIT